MPGKEAHAEKYRKVNDYDIKKLSISAEHGEDIDLRMMFSQLHVYEDIYSNNVSGVIIIKDTVNLISNLPINGREKVKFSFITPGLDGVPAEKEATVYKVDEIVRTQGQRGQLYKLFFTTEEKITNEYTKVSKSYTGKISKMVEDILGEYLPSAELVTNRGTAEVHRFIMPRWSPFKCINWLAGRAESQEKPTQSNYLFYEDMDGYHFTDLGFLFDQEPKAKYTYNPISGHQVYGTEGPEFSDLNKAFYNATGFRVTSAFDTLNRLDEGMYASTLTTHDITKKKFETYTYDYKAEFGNTNHIYGNPLTSGTDMLHGRVDTKFHYQPKQDKQHTEGVDPDNLKYENWFLSRKSLLVQAHGQKIEIEIPGNSSLRVGDVIDFSYADMKELTKESSEYIEKTFSGYYLISAIHHMMEGEHYRCNLELIRDSRYEQIPVSSSLSSRSDSSAFAGGGN